VTRNRLFERMLGQREEVPLIRGSTVRSNIAYSVVDGGNSPAARSPWSEAVVTETLTDPTQPHAWMTSLYRACLSALKRSFCVEVGMCTRSVHFGSADVTFAGRVL